jgi:hypothetical protein
MQQDAGVSTGAVFGRGVYLDVRALALLYLLSHGILAFATTLFVMPSFFFPTLPAQHQSTSIRLNRKVFEISKETKRYTETQYVGYLD